MISNKSISTIKILVPGRIIDLQTLHFTCESCGCEFEVNEAECSVDIPKVYSGGVPVFVDYSGAQASYPCPTENCLNMCWTTFYRKFKGETT